MVWPTLGSRTAKEQNRGVAMDNYAEKYPENQRNVFSECGVQSLRNLFVGLCMGEHS